MGKIFRTPRQIIRASKEGIGRRRGRLGEGGNGAPVRLLSRFADHWASASRKQTRSASEDSESKPDAPASASSESKPDAPASASSRIQARSASECIPSHTACFRSRPEAELERAMHSLALRACIHAVRCGARAESTSHHSSVTPVQGRFPRSRDRGGVPGVAQPKSEPLQPGGRPGERGGLGDTGDRRVLQAMALHPAIDAPVADDCETEHLPVQSKGRVSP